MINRKKSFLSMIAVITVFCILSVIIWAYIFFTQDHFWKSVKTKVEMGSDIIYFQEVTDFEWDVVCVLAPYSTVGGDDNIQRLIKGDVLDIKDKIPNLSDDGKWAFIFLKDGKAIHVSQKGRKYYLYRMYKDNCMRQANAIFAVKGDTLYVRTNDNDLKFGFPAASTLVLDLNGDGLTLVSINGRKAVYWDIDNDGFKEASGWVDGGDGVLAIDLNKDGIINNQSELFGNYTSKQDGFISLSLYDSNKDGLITPDDDQFNELLVWIDSKRDGFSHSSELHSFASLGITTIYLNKNHVAGAVDGNKIVYDSTFVMRGKTHKIADILFDYSDVNTIYAGEYNAELRTLFLPHIKGYGILPSLSVEMSLNQNLIDMMTQIVISDASVLFSSKFNIKEKMTALLYEWARVLDINPQERGPNIDARKLSFVEAFSGKSFLQLGRYPDPRPQAAKFLEEAFGKMYNNLSAGILMQTRAKDIFQDSPKFKALTGNFMKGKWSLDLNVIQKIITAEKLNDKELERKWTEIIRFIHYTAGIDQLSRDDKVALDNLIKASSNSQELRLDVIKDFVIDHEIK